MKRLFIICLLPLIAAVLLADTKTTTTVFFSVEKGQIGNAHFVVAVPTKWQKGLVLRAHGYIPADAPMKANPDLESPFIQILLKEGWMIAYTSYRRNGLIFRDAIKDIEALRQYVSKKYANPDTTSPQTGHAANHKNSLRPTILLGESMGGIIGTLIAESIPRHYDGVLSLGTGSFALTKIENIQLTYAPKIPVLFLSNRDEIQHPRNYIKSVPKTARVPVLWGVNRDGHVNLSNKEIEKAFRALVLYVEKGTRPETHKDATVIPVTGLSGAVFKDGGAYAPVTRVHPTYGNMDTPFTQEDLEKLGIQYKTYFSLEFKKQKVKVFFGSTYGDVPRGEWLAALNAEGKLKFARNYENAAKTLGCAKGDTLFIKPRPKQ
ncbi:MAG: SAM-dependent chlorinase/fluorinase [bacterium]|nr:SAM-dependent chlorinase/fluorinase [bacterium]